MAASRSWSCFTERARKKPITTRVRDQVLPSPNIAIVGHSYGALLGARIVSAAPANYKAFVALGGAWNDWLAPPNPVKTLGVPALLIAGDADAIGDATFVWGGIPAAPHGKHRATLKNGEHFDYSRDIGGALSPCAAPPGGSCPMIGRLSADLATIFLSKHMPPQNSGMLPHTIPDDLTLPTENPTSEQTPYLGGHLLGLALLPTSPQCGLSLSWHTPNGPGSRTLP